MGDIVAATIEPETAVASAGPGAALAAALPPEIAFLEGFGIGRPGLAAAVAMAARTGVTADRALLAVGALSAEDFYRLLAAHIGVAFLEHPLPVAEHVAIDGAMDIEIVPLAPNAQGVDFVLAPRGDVLARLLERFGPQHRGSSPRVAITTPRRLSALIRHRHRRAIVREASEGLSTWNPRLSALAGWTIGQRGFGFLLGFSIAAGLGLAPASTFEAVCLALSLLFAAMVAVRLAATLASPPRRPVVHPRRRDDDLPVYTIVVPLFREARVVPRLVDALMRLDYPVLGSKLT